MPKHIDQPCKDGLTAACFAQEPLFARRAFSFRLLSAFVPPAMSRRLLTFLGLIRFDPAGNLPDWLNLPPWWIILPGAIIPPGWKFGDPVFDGLYQVPNFYQDRSWKFGDPIFDGVDQAARFLQDRNWKYPVGPDHLSAMGSGPKSRSYAETSPATGDWIRHTDDTKWQDDASYVRRAFWSEAGQYWYGEPSAFRIEVIGTWYDGFQPTHLRFVLNGISSCSVYLQFGSGDFTIVYESNYSSGDELELTWIHPSINMETLLIITSGAQVSNIEFFVPYA